MAYANAWNEAAPDGAVVPVSDLDTVIQDQVKKAIRERLNQVVNDWDDDAVDPKRLKVLGGLASSRPAAGGAATPDGTLFYATDEDTLYIVDGGAWVAITGVAGFWSPQGPINSVQGSTGANTTEVVLQSITIPADVLGANGLLRIFVSGQDSGSANDRTVRLKISDGTTVFEAQVISFATGNQIGFFEIEAHLVNRNDKSAQFSSTRYMATANKTVDGDHAPATLDTTQALTIQLTGQTADSADDIVSDLLMAEIRTVA